jgi:ArsR family transcriptional regulator
MSRYNKILKSISDEKRIKLISLLIKEKGEFYVCEISDALEESQYNVSKYLKELKNENLVKERRSGRGVLYSAIEPADDFLKLIFQAILSIPENYIDRNVKLLRLRVSMRDGNKCVARLQKKNWKNALGKTKPVN